MYFVESATIKEFWGDKTVEVDFHPDVSFLIGVNGSGKTTLLNLISAMLRADYPMLLQSPFSEATVHLRRHGHPTRPTISVKKEPGEGGTIPNIKYTIRENPKAEPKIFLFDDFAGERYRMLVHNLWRSSKRQSAQQSDLIDQLAQFIHVTWLSIHRGTPLSRRDDDESYDSTVDKKLHDISNGFSRYFSLLSAKAEAEVKTFQEFMFLSLLYKRGAEKVVVVKVEEMEKQKETLKKIFIDFEMKDFELEVNEHFQAAKNAITSYNEGKNISMADIVALVEARRINEVVKRWTKLQEKLSEIFLPKNTFAEIINSLINKKILTFNLRNQPSFTTTSDKKFGPEQLSSGEKQLYILLGETLLQEKKPYVFFADEPELSLHVTWQDKLVENMMRLNPNAQFIIATHSPDIVSNFGNRVIEIEKRIR
jgi:predicted ATP-binding protein involved in virulence